ncbi:MAG: DHA2 family efflux MFS transporter permease subunit [Desulfovibrionaceae bacterium]
MAADAYPPLSGMKLALGAVFISMANFIVVLDTTITNVSIPTISGDLGVSTSEGTWVITAYAVAEAITIPLTGWLLQRFGQVRVFLVSLASFIIFSICCGLSGSLGLLLLFRILQGLGGGPLIPLSIVLLLSIFPKDKSAVALAIWGMTTVVAPIAGPVLGGWICDVWTWPWIFYINIAFGLAVGGVSWWLVHDRETPTRKARIDVVGLILLTVFVTTFQFMIDKGRELDWFASNFIVCCGIISFISLAVLIVWELTDKNPVIDLSVFASRNWLLSTVTLCLMFGLFFGNVVLTPLWLQQQMGYTALWAGLATAPMGFLAVATSPLIGRLLPRIDPRMIVTYGMCVLAASFFMRSQFTSQVDFGAIALAMFILGAGSPACLITLTSLGVSDLSPEKVAGGTGLQNFLRVMSMAVGGSLAQTYWENAAKVNRAELVGIINTSVNQLDAPAGLPADAVLPLFSHSVTGQAVMLATNSFYAYAAILMLVFAAVIWFVKPPRGRLQAGSGH